MNKTKRGLQLGAAITSIVFASILAVSAIYLLIVTNNLIRAWGDAEYSSEYSLTSSEYSLISSEYSLIMIIYILILLFSIATIIVSALICRKPNEKMHLGLCVADLVLNSLLAILYIAAGTPVAVMPIIIVGLFIAELCVKNKKATEIVTSSGLNNSEDVKVDAKTENNMGEKTSTEQKSGDLKSNEKIEKIKKLNKEGILSDEEMKKLIIEELKKD